MPFAFACLALSMLLVGGNIAIGKLILAEVPVYLFAALRFLIAGLVLLPGMFLADIRRGLDRRACGGQLPTGKASPSWRKRSAR